MRKKGVILFVTFALLMAGPVYAVAAAPPNSCVACHTNESLMKSMHKPPDLPKSAGEG